MVGKLYKNSVKYITENFTFLTRKKLNYTVIVCKKEFAKVSQFFVHFSPEIFPNIMLTLFHINKTAALKIFLPNYSSVASPERKANIINERIYFSLIATGRSG